KTGSHSTSRIPARPRKPANHACRLTSHQEPLHGIMAARPAWTRETRRAGGHGDIDLFGGARFWTSRTFRFRTRAEEETHENSSHSTTRIPTATSWDYGRETRARVEALSLNSTFKPDVASDYGQRKALCMLSCTPPRRPTAGYDECLLDRSEGCHGFLCPDNAPAASENYNAGFPDVYGYGYEAVENVDDGCMQTGYWQPGCWEEYHRRRCEILYGSDCEGDTGIAGESDDVALADGPYIQYEHWPGYGEELDAAASDAIDDTASHQALEWAYLWHGPPIYFLGLGLTKDSWRVEPHAHPMGQYVEIQRLDQCCECLIAPFNLPSRLPRDSGEVRRGVPSARATHA
ncbi:hypothetical protein B0H14DRAFT_3691343, partial [Mycena olivaceomarginata]